MTFVPLILFLTKFNANTIRPSEQLLDWAKILRQTLSVPFKQMGTCLLAQMCAVVQSYLLLIRPVCIAAQNVVQPRSTAVFIPHGPRVAVLN